MALRILVDLILLEVERDPDLGMTLMPSTDSVASLESGALEDEVVFLVKLVVVPDLGHAFDVLNQGLAAL